MGFDLYGLDPKSSSPRPRREDYQDSDDYYDAKWAWEESTPGAYFRRTIFSWPPLWERVCSICGEVLISRREFENGHYNDGLRFDAARSKQIAAAVALIAQQDDDEDLAAFARFADQSGGFEIW